MVVDPDTRLPIASGFRTAWTLFSHVERIGSSIAPLVLVGGACRSTQTVFQCLRTVVVVVVCISMQIRQGVPGRKVSLVTAAVNSSSQRFLQQ